MTTDLGDPNRADRVRHRGSLRNQDIDLAQLRNDLFGGVSLLTHSDPPSALTSHTSGWTTPTGADHPPTPATAFQARSSATPCGSTSGSRSAYAWWTRCWPP